jgi:capsular polysaccharide biosynthesis protein
MATMTDAEFVPLETLKRVFSHWWLIAVMAILGGIVGWAIHFLLPPIYEATATLTVSMDFTQVGELSQYDQDYAFSAAGAIIDSSTVQEQVIQQAQTNGITVTQSDLAKIMFAEGRQSDWELHVRNSDSRIAAGLANTWAQVANDALNAALGHAMRAAQLQTQINQLDACLPIEPWISGSNPQSFPAPIECERYTLSDINTNLQNWTNELAYEKELTQGILSIMEFSQTSEASIPDTPILYDRGSMTLAGAVIGLIISLWVAGSLKGRSRA